MARKRHDPRLASARAYFRLAAKADRAGNYHGAEHYRRVADGLVRQAERARQARLERRGV